MQRKKQIHEQENVDTGIVTPVNKLTVNINPFKVYLADNDLSQT